MTNMRRFFGTMTFGIAILFAFLTTVAVANERVLVFDVTLPITAGMANSLKRNIENAVNDLAATQNIDPNADANAGPLATFVFRMTVPPDQENYGRGSMFASCYELATLISGPKLAEVKTTTFFPNAAQGHAILVALACDEIYMANDSQIGEAAVDEPQLTQTIRQAYREISERRSKVPYPVIDKMLDPTVELMQVETEKGTTVGSSILSMTG